MLLEYREGMERDLIPGHSPERMRRRGVKSSGRGNRPTEPLPATSRKKKQT